MDIKIYYPKNLVMILYVHTNSKFVIIIIFIIDLFLFLFFTIIFTFPNDNHSNMYWYYFLVCHLIPYHQHCKHLTYMQFIIIKNNNRDKYVRINDIWQCWMELKAWSFINHCKQPTCCNLSHCCILLNLPMNKPHSCEILMYRFY